MKSELVLQAIKKSLSLVPGEIFCAVSGGLDSMVLLEAFHRLGVSGVTVLHVNHNLRGAESDGDEAFVRAAARRMGYHFSSLGLEWAGEKPSQASCRKKRMEFFRESLREDDRIYLAHHQDDQAETVLQRIFRGSGLHGLKGMAEVSGQKIRPLLGISRASLELAALEWGVKWRDDSSNSTNKYERNWLRHEIMPLLEAHRPGVARRIADLAREAAELPVNAPFLTPYLEDGWSVYRSSELARATSSHLSAIFGLSRLHTKSLAHLLSKGAGQHTAEGKRFHLSRGILLAENKMFPRLSSRREEGDRLHWENVLGKWGLPLAGVGSASALHLGDKAKKEFQRADVPIFFRELVPLFVRAGKPTALLPTQLNHAGATLELSDLGRWWLTPS